jgi:hypothetical protein
MALISVCRGGTCCSATCGGPSSSAEGPPPPPLPPPLPPPPLLPPPPPPPSPLAGVQCRKVRSILCTLSVVSVLAVDVVAGGVTGWADVLV